MAAAAWRQAATDAIVASASFQGAVSVDHISPPWTALFDLKLLSSLRCADGHRCQQWCWRMAVGDEAYVRRRHWSWDEKLTAVEEAGASSQVIATAKRDGIQIRQVYRCRGRLLGRHVPLEFAAVSIVPDPPAALPALVPDIASAGYRSSGWR